jgi:hypothetical protein
MKICNLKIYPNLLYGEQKKTNCNKNNKKILNKINFKKLIIIIIITIIM